MPLFQYYSSLVRKDNDTRSSTAKASAAADSMASTADNNHNRNRTQHTATETTNPPLETRVLKAVREFEHGRQRARKSAETSHWKEQKARHRQLKADRAQGVIHPPSAYLRPRQGRARAQDVVHDERVLSDDSDWDAPEAAEPEPVDSPRQWRGEALEVDLMNLAKPAKKRKSKGMHIFLSVPLQCDLIGSIAAGDFEVIPKMPSVIVLEDCRTPTPEDDEAWECLSAASDDVDRKRPVPSYAEVAAGI
ncbi:hypothetical protein K474DRAFT_1655499 [Panus rudis PR-1116 ss-1]|nr:hypothetical protein K474DRAFT_1655499 [Panus rudis PR-1116 ss-1]